jgi:hypothetical protein
MAAWYHIMTAWKINRKQLEKQENYEIMEGLKGRKEKRRKNGKNDVGQKRDREKQIL